MLHKYYSSPCCFNDGDANDDGDCHYYHYFQLTFRLINSNNTPASTHRLIDVGFGGLRWAPGF